MGKLWSELECQLKDPKTSEDSIKNELADAYLDSAGGLIEVNPACLDKKNHLTALELIEIIKCRDNPNRTHSDDSCDVRVAVFTEKGIGIAKELILDRMSRIDQQIQDMLAQTPYQIFLAANYICEKNSVPQITKKEVNELKKHLLDKKTFAFVWNYDFQASAETEVFSPSSLFLPIDSHFETLWQNLSKLGLVKLKPSYHTLRGWSSLDGIRSSKEVFEHIFQKRNQTKEDFLVNFAVSNSTNLLKLRTLQTIQENSGLLQKDIVEIEIQFPLYKQKIIDFIKTLVTQGYLKPTSSIDGKYTVEKNLDKTKNQLYEEIEKTNREWWSNTKPTYFKTAVDKADKIKAKTVDLTTPKPPTKNTVIVDASNVSRNNVPKIPKGRQARYNQILLAEEYYKQKGYEVILVADPNLRHIIDDKDEFQTRLDKGEILQSPAKIKADEYILKIPSEEGSKFTIVSNDQFLDYPGLVDDCITKGVVFQKFEVFQNKRFIPL